MNTVAKLVLLLIITLALGTLQQAAAQDEEVVRRVFPDLTFERPVAIRNGADGTNRLHVVEQPGRIQSFKNVPDRDAPVVLLDLTDKVSYDEVESGMLGVAFHPGFVQNGYFYVTYVTEEGDGPFRWRLSRFTADHNGGTADPESELILLDLEKQGNAHNGGDLHFGVPEGPEGEQYLYVSIGDGLCCGDPLGNGQDRTTLFSSLLRLDVDQPTDGLNYGIPPDNPFVENAEGWREEIWAYGFRNPWRFSIDPVTGQIWLGDVGELMWEEVNLVSSGNNYGWNRTEGPDCYKTDPCDTTDLVAPLWSYEHDDSGGSVTGGYIYRGSIASDLYGTYIFADWSTRKLWSLEYTPDEEPDVTLLSDFTGLFISSFGTDEDGELLMLNTFLGEIYQLAPLELDTDPTAPTGLDFRLSGPNPFRTQTSVEFRQSRPGPARVAVYDLLGRELLVLLDRNVAAGEVTRLRIPAHQLTAGTYVVRMESGGESASKRITLVR